MSKQLTIQQWFARAAATGLLPDWSNVFACWYSITKRWAIDNGKSDGEIISTIVNIPPSDNKYCNRVIQLRKDGVDLVELEWSKPTEDNIGEMCWFANENKYRMPEIDSVHDLRLIDNSEDDAVYYYAWGSEYSHSYCLLATNGNIAPKPEDFRKVYGEI